MHRFPFTAIVGQERLKRALLVNAVNPGAIATGLQRHVGGKLATPADQQKTPQQGASTSVFAAVPGLAIAGAPFEGVGVPACIRDAYRAVDSLL